MVDSCRLGSKANQLQVDENGFRPLRKAFRVKVGPKSKGDAAAGQKVTSGLHTGECEGSRAAASAVVSG